MGQYEICRDIGGGIIVCDTIPQGISMTLRLTSDVVPGCENLYFESKPEKGEDSWKGPNSGLSV